MKLVALSDINEWPDPPPVELPVLYEDAWYGKNECRVRAFACEEEEWGTLYLEMDCVSPPSNHWLSYCFDTTGNLSDIMCVDNVHGSVERMIMEHGIAPGQPFYLSLSFSYTRDYWGEYDEETDWEITSVVPWSRERVLTEWEAYWGRKLMMKCLGQP